MHCSTCEIEFETADSIGSEHLLCQDCWEEHTAGLFWKAGHPG